MTLEVDFIPLKYSGKIVKWHPINRPRILEAIRRDYGLDFNLYTGSLYQIFYKEDLFEEGFIPNDKDIVVDIGASIGEYAIWAAQKCKKVYAFEPYRINYNKLLDNIKRNNILNIEPHMLAIGESNCNATMNVVIQSPMSGSLDKDVMSYKKLKMNKREATNIEIKTKDITVPVISIDSFFIYHRSLFMSNDQPTFFNIDVEGFEFSVLRGMIEILKRNDCRLIIEIHKEFEISIIEQFLSNLNYQLIKKKLCGTHFRNTKLNTYYEFFKKRHPV